MSPLPSECRQSLTLYARKPWLLIWTICYLSVLLGLSAYGIHRYVIIYLFLKNRKRPVSAEARFEQLPKVTVQLPIYNEVYVVERLLQVGQRTRLSAGTAPDPGAGRFHR